jgi:hypothetical protein
VPTWQRRASRPIQSHGAKGRPILLGTLDVPFDHDAVDNICLRSGETQGSAASFLTGQLLDYGRIIL